MSLTPGTRLGPYEIRSMLGAGGMGQVYRARDRKLNRDVAVKVVVDDLHDPEQLARFRREAQLLAALNHPDIATIYGLEETQDTQFLVMELVEGETLAERIRQATSQKPQGTSHKESTAGLPVDDALGIARQIAEALQAAHEKGIVHRDLKPANIALTTEGQVKVLDFGLAKTLETASAGDVSASPTLSMAQVLFEIAMLPPTGSIRPFDLTPDGRFIVIRPAQEETGSRTAPSLVLVQNWCEELRRLVPTD